MPMLTEQERQEITRYLDADKPLPDRYRFLLFENKRQVELVWNGKTNEVSNIVLPFQVIEQVDEPRAEKPADTVLQRSLFDLDERGRQLRGWTNKLIWGDNRLVLSSLKNGPLRDEIEAAGGLKLIYIDPPFDVGADFSMDIEVGDGTLTKRPNILEEIAYRDTWGKGTDSFVSMMYERLSLMRDLLANDGSIYVHVDWRVNAPIRFILDELFSSSGFRNHIVWCYTRSRPGGKQFARLHEDIFFYTKSDQYDFNMPRVPLSPNTSPPKRIVRPDGSVWERTSYDKDCPDWWDITFHHRSPERQEIGYPTQKPEALLDRVIQASSHEGDLVADFFCGSGTTLAVAEKLGRRWIGCDLGKFAIHTTRKRMIGVQRQLKAAGKDYRAFEILNLGKYERQHYVGVNPNLREAEREQQQKDKEAAFVELILRAYRAEGVIGYRTFQGKKAGRLVAVGPVNLPVSRLFVEEVILECREKHVTRVDILGFEFEMGLFPNVLDEARNKGIDIVPKYIPAEVFDKRAVEKNQVVFHDVAYIEVKPHVRGNRVSVELTDFSVFYSQDSIAEAETTLKNKGSKVVVDKGQIVRVSKDATGMVTREVLTKTWSDWIDYWAVDFNYESKREFVRVPIERMQQGQMPGMERRQLQMPDYEEVWTGDYVFENEWQTFRTKKDRTLELRSVEQECVPGRRKIAVKVVDIFGNDTMTIVEVTVGGRR